MALSITTIDTNGTKSRALNRAEFGYDDHTDVGRVWIGTTAGIDIALAKLTEVEAVQDIINDASLMHPVDTIADLRNETGKYKYVYVTGYHTKDDGAFGSNIFVWDENSTETDNGGTIIKCTTVTTGRYRLKYSGDVNVKWFGAKGDGVKDDTSAIQAALTFVGVSGGRVYFPRGTYIIAGGGTTYVFELIDYNNISICGDGAGNTVIKVADNGDRGIFSYANCNSIELADLTLDANASNGVTGLGGHGVRLDDCDDVYFHNIVVRDTQGYGMGFQGYGDFKRVVLDTIEIIDSGADGVDFKNRANSNDALTINNVVIRNPSRIEDGKPGLDIRGPATINNVAVFLKSDDGIGIRFRASATEPGQNGVGGRHSSLSNFYVDGGGYASTTGVVIDDPNISISNGSAINVRGVGVWLTLNSQNSHVSNVHVGGGVDCINFEIAGTGNSIIGCSSDEGNTGYRINGADNRLLGCTHEGGTYGFRRTSGTTKNYLIGCKSTGAAVTNLGTVGIDSILSSDFGGSDTTPHDLCVNGNTALRFSPVPGGVNYLQLATGAPGDGPSITVGGAEGSRPLRVGARSSHVSFLTAGTTLGANEQLRVLHTSGAVNYATVKGSTANIPVSLSAEGSDAAIDLLLSPKGTGNIRFGTHNTSADVAITGYITIKDGSGNLRKLAVIS